MATYLDVKKKLERVRFIESVLRDTGRTRQDEIVNEILIDAKRDYRRALKRLVEQEDTKHFDCKDKREEVEVCPHCDTEVTIMWDVKAQGYRATCPNCGEELMLCDACMHSDDNEGMHCDWSEERGCFRHPKEK